MTGAGSERAGGFARHREQVIKRWMNFDGADCAGCFLDVVRETDFDAYDAAPVHPREFAAGQVTLERLWVTISHLSQNESGEFL